MKKVYLFFIIFMLSSSAQSQLLEDFEQGLNANGWTQHRSSSLNASLQESWGIQYLPHTPIDGLNSAFINRENSAQGDTTEYWLISPITYIRANDKLSFLGRQTIAGNQGCIFEVWITDGARTDYSNYTQIASWTEDEYSPGVNVDVTKIIGLNNYASLLVYVAFVKRYTQPSSALTGDRWMIDNVKIDNGSLDISSHETSSFKIYPNPTQNEWNFEAKDKTIESVRIIDLLGKIVLSVSTKNSLVTIDALGLESGFYFAEIVTETEIKKVALIKK